MTENPTIVRPADAGELREIVAQAVGSGRAIEVRAGGSKRDIGNPEREPLVVDIQALSGIVDYEPSELVITLRPATPLSEVEAALASHRQMLAFEPWDHGALFGRSAGEATIGGIVAAGVAGSRRVSAGSARDHLLGFAAVSGRGEEFKGGGKVVKNVTGYDISKVMAGSWGQLAVMAELTLKVVPMPRNVTTVAWEGLSAQLAIVVMSKALGSPCAPAAAAHLPPFGAAPALTMIRLEGFQESVEVRAAQLISALAEVARGAVVDEHSAADLWTAVREARPLASAETLWRVHAAPSRAASLAAALEANGATWFYDWAGALLWVGAPAHVDVRAATDAGDGHAMLLRAPFDKRKLSPARHPAPPGIAALTARLKRAFDPAGILDPQRFG